MKSPASKPSRRGRPARSAQQAEASRGVIIDAARSLFAAEGYDGVSMRKVAAMAECSPATLYTLFPNKRQLLRYLWEAVFTDLFTELERVYAQHAEAQRLEALCVAFVDFWLARPADYRAIFLIEDRLQDADDRYFVDSANVLPRLTLVRRCIVEAQARGELRAGDADAIQNILLCGLQGVALNLITIPEYPWGDANTLTQEMVRVMLAGLR